MKIPFIKPGDKVGLISAAGPVTKMQVQEGLDFLTANGFKYEIGKYAFENAGIVSASIEKRLEDIHSFIERDDIAAVWALRGGYGSVHLFEDFNYDLLKQHPKLLIGFSDITALQWAIFGKIRLPSFSGFTLTMQLNNKNPYTPMGLKMLFGNKTMITEQDILEPLQIITPGEVKGTLIGGTLTMICSICGTPYFVEDKDIVLYIEDIDEPLYRIDRCLQQLKLLKFFARVKGVILGQFLYENGALDIVAQLKPLLSPKTPIIANLPYKHHRDSLPMFQGVYANFNASPFELSWD
jgi:muramoyltetrapeptide carboxypeptidase